MMLVSRDQILPLVNRSMAIHRAWLGVIVLVRVSSCATIFYSVTRIVACADQVVSVGFKHKVAGIVVGYFFN